MLKFRLNTLFVLLISLLGFNGISAQVLVSVSPKQNPLPPQAAIYFDNPGRLFNVSLNNTDMDQTISVRLEAQVQGPIENNVNIWPDGDSFLMISSRRKMPHPIVLQPGQTRHLSPNELRNHFKDYDQVTEMMSGGRLRSIFDAGPTSGLLPEGHYGLKLIVKTNEDGDVLGEAFCFFDICYLASAPVFVEPNAKVLNDASQDEAYETIAFPEQQPRFSWLAPTFSNRVLAHGRQFVYNFRLTRVMPGQTPYEAVDKGTVAYQQNGLLTTYCNIPVNVVRALQNSGSKYYVAQVTAIPVVNNQDNPDYSVVNNGGKSEVLVLDLDLSSSEGNSDPDIVIPDEDNGASAKPVIATIEPKTSVLTDNISDYLSSPGSLFRVTLENTTTENLRLSLLLQFFKENWGVCAAPNRQYNDRYMELPAKTKVTLEDEELNRLAGEYNFDTDAIAFKAKTGFIIGKPSGAFFPEKENNVALRVCHFTGQRVLRERVAGKARNVFFTNSQTEKGNRLEVTITKKMELLPSTAQIYFENPHKLFTFKIKNITKQLMRVSPQLTYSFGLAEYFSGDYREHAPMVIKLQPGEEKTLTDEEVREFFGNFKEAYSRDKNTGWGQKYAWNELPVDELFNSAILTLYDAEKMEMYEGFEKFQKSVIQEKTIGFQTSAHIQVGNIIVSFTKNYEEMPGEASNYFQLPGRIFNLSLQNISDKTLHVRPQIEYTFKNKEERYTAISQDTEDFMTLQPRQTLQVPEKTVQKFCSGERACQIVKEGDKEVKTEIEMEGIALDYEEINVAKLKLWNVDSLKLIAREDPAYSKRCLESTALCDFNAYEGARLRDVDVRMTRRLERMPRAAAPYFSKPASLWNMQLTNRTQGDKKLKLVLSYIFDHKGDPEIYSGDKSKQLNLTLDLKAGETRSLTPREIHDLLSSERVIRHKRNGKEEDFEEKVFDVNTLVVNYDEERGYHAFLKVYDAKLWEEKKLEYPTEEMLLGEAEENFLTDEGVNITDIVVSIKTKMNPMPGDGNHYFKSPGAIFEVGLENTTFEDLTVLPVLNYIFSNDGSYFGGAPKNRLDSCFVLKAEEKKTLTGKELNRVCGYFEEINHYKVSLKGDDIEKIQNFANLVNLQNLNMAQVAVYNVDTLKNIPESNNERLTRALMGNGKTEFKADKDVTLTTIAVKIVPKKTADFPHEAEPYFMDPGKFFDVTITNTAGEDAKVNLRLTYNHLYFANKPDSVISIEADQVKKLTAEEINDLSGEMELEKILKIGENGKFIQPEEEIKIEGGENHITALVWKKDKPEEKKTFKVDTLATNEATYSATFREVKIGDYFMVMEEAKKDSVCKKTGDNCYSGNGYIKWNPFHLPLRIACEYKGLHVNEEGIVTKGEVLSSKPREFFSWEDTKKALAGIAPEKYKDSLDARLEDSKIAEYYTHVMQDMKIIDDIAQGKMTLPARLPHMLTQDSPIELQLTSMRFTPDTATMNILAEFVIPESNYTKTSEGILVFSAEELPIGEDTWLPRSGVMKLITDFTVMDPKSGFDFTFLAPQEKEEDSKKNSNKKKDDKEKVRESNGCYVAWANEKFEEVTIDAKMSIPSGDIVKYHEDITEEDVKNGIDLTPDIRLTARIADAEDWSGRVMMDAFQFKDAPGYTFNFTGDKSGITYDHSKKWNPDGFNIPSNYDLEKADLKGKDPKEWQGLYFEELSVSFPKFIELNNTGEDRRLKVGLKDMIGDKSGFSCNLFAHDIIKYSSEKKDKEDKEASIGGWCISIDTLSLSILQNDFNNFKFTGVFGIPLLKGEIGYIGKVNAIRNSKGEVGNEVIFETRQADSLNLDFWLAKAYFQKEQTYFNVTYTDFPKIKDRNTTVELCMGGLIDITCTDKLDFLFKGFRFSGLRLANFSNKEKTNEENATASASGTSATSDKSTKEYKNDANTVFFSLGSWSLASEQKEFWDLPITLNALKLKTDGTDRVGLYVNGGLSVMGNKKCGLAASVGLTVYGKVDWDQLDLAYDTTDFEDLQVKGSFGGVIKVDGSLEVPHDDDRSGFKGQLDLDMKGLFKMKVAGAYLKVKKDESAFAKDTDEERKDSTFKAGFFYGEASDLPSLGAVTLNSVLGGLYINYGISSSDLSEKGALKEALQNPVLRYKSYGGAFGIGLAVGDDSFVKGDFNLLTLIEMEGDKAKVADFHLQGNVHALCAKGSDEGLVNAQADILYKDSTTENKAADEYRKFKLNITLDAGADFADAYKYFTGQEFKMPEALADLQEFSQEKADEQGDGSNGSDASTVNADGSRNKSKAEMDAENRDKNGFAAMKAHLSMELEVRHYPYVNETKWHLYLGRPEESERLRITFIDFAIGKDKPVGLWAKIYANAYLCLGNEMPDDGALPEVPEKVREALGMKGADGKVDESQGSRLDEIRRNTVKDGPHGKTEGGVMFGAALGGEFGCNAVFCYAELEAILGFDMVLKKFAKDCLCTDGKPMGGKNGFYATGQLYSMLRGELGLMLDLWIFKGKIPLVDMTLGALLKGGFPNPSWAYGRLRAKGSVLGGLIKFSSTIEAKVGRVCIPEYGNPLEDIKIFGDVQPGEDDLAKGWEGNETSCYVDPTFTTNMKMGARLDLIDEGERAERAGMWDDESKHTATATRSYIFHLEPNFLMETFSEEAADDSQPVRQRYIEYRSSDQENYELKTGSLQPYTKYKITLRGYCKELVDGREVDPVFKDKESNYKQEHRSWSQECLAYFKTGGLSDNINDEVKGFCPMDGEEMGGTLEEVTRPYAMLARSRDDYFNAPEHRLYATITEFPKGTPLKEIKEAPGRLPDVMYDDTGQRIPGQVSEFEEIEVRQLVERGVDGSKKEKDDLNRKNGKLADYDYEYVSMGLSHPLPERFFKTDRVYRMRVYRVNLAEMNRFFAAVEENYKSISKMTEREREELERKIEELNDDEGNEILKDLYAYYKEVDKNYGDNSAEQRLHEYAEQMKLQSTNYSEIVFEQVYTYNGARTFKDQFMNPGLLFSMNGDQLPLCRLDEMHLSQPDYSLTIHNDPYKALNYWQSTAAVWVPTKKYDLCDKGFNHTPPGFRYKADMEEARKMQLNDTQLSDKAYTESYSPEYSRLNPKNEWRVSGYAATCYAGNWADNYKRHYNERGITGNGLADAFVHEIIQTRFRDAAASQSLQKAMHTLWNQYTHGASYRAFCDARANKGGNKKAFFKKWKNSMNLAMSNNTYITVSCNDALMQSKSYESSAFNSEDQAVGTITFPEAQTGLMVASADGADYFGLGIRDRETSAPLYMSQPDKLFDVDNMPKVTSCDISVKRNTGYNTVNAEFGLRPSTATRYTFKAQVKPGELPLVIDDVIDSDRPAEIKIDSKSGDSVYIPDDNFRAYVLSHFDRDHDNRLSTAEAEAIRSIEYKDRYKYICTLQGIEAMTHLDTLTILFSRNMLKDVNLSFNSNLKWLSLGNAGFDKLDLSNMRELTFLNISDNPHLKELDLHHNRKLERVFIHRTGISRLDLEGLSQINTLGLRKNQIDTLNLTPCHKLNVVSVGNQYDNKKRNKFMMLYLGHISDGVLRRLEETGAVPLPEPSRPKPRLQEIYYDSPGDNNANVLYVVNKPSIDELDKNLVEHLKKTYGMRTSDFSADLVFDEYLFYRNLKEATSLTANNLHIKSIEGLDYWMPSLLNIAVSGNDLTEIDVSCFKRLHRLDVSNNEIEYIVADDNNAITELNCENNQLQALNAGRFKSLEELRCSHNPMKQLFTEGCDKLRLLHAHDNGLTRLDLANMDNLEELDASNNVFEAHRGSLTGTKLILPRHKDKLTRLVVSHFNDGNADLYVKVADYSHLKYIDISNSSAVKELQVPYGIEQIHANRCEQLNSLVPGNLDKLSNLTTLDAGYTCLRIDLPSSGSKLEELNITDAYRKAQADNTHWGQPISFGAKNNAEIHHAGKDAESGTVHLYVNHPNLKVLKVGVPNCKKGTKIHLHLESQNMVTLWENIWKHYEENKYTVLALVNDKPLDPSEKTQLEEMSSDDELMRKDLGPVYDKLKRLYNPKGRFLHTEDIKDVKVLDCSNSNIENLNRIIRWMPQLVELYANSNCIKTADLHTHKELRHVDLSNNRDLTDVYLSPSASEGKAEDLLKGRGSCLNIQTLNVAYTNVFGSTAKVKADGGVLLCMEDALLKVHRKIYAKGATGKTPLRIGKKVKTQSVDLSMTAVPLKLTEDDGEGADSQIRLYGSGHENVSKLGRRTGARNSTLWGHGFSSHSSSRKALGGAPNANVAPSPSSREIANAVQARGKRSVEGNRNFSRDAATVRKGEREALQGVAKSPESDLRNKTGASRINSAEGIDTLIYSGCEQPLCLPDVPHVTAIECLKIGSANGKTRICCEKAAVALRWYLQWKAQCPNPDNIDICIKTHTHKGAACGYFKYTLEQLITAVYDQHIVEKGTDFDELLEQYIRLSCSPQKAESLMLLLKTLQERRDI